MKTSQLNLVVKKYLAKDMFPCKKVQIKILNIHIWTKVQFY